MKGDSPSFYALIAGPQPGSAFWFHSEVAGAACGPRRWVARGVRGRARGVRLAGAGVGRGAVALGPRGWKPAMGLRL